MKNVLDKTSYFKWNIVKNKLFFFVKQKKGLNGKKE